jgi:hypothetical protein
MYMVLPVKYTLFLSDFGKTRIFSIISEKNSQNIKFHENPSIVNRVVPCGQTWQNMVLQVKYTLFLSDFDKTRTFSIISETKFSKYQISWKSVHWESSCSVRSNMTKLTVDFRHFTNAPTKGKRPFRIRIYIIFFVTLDDKSKRRETIIQWYGLISLLSSKRICNQAGITINYEIPWQIQKLSTSFIYTGFTTFTDKFSRDSPDLPSTYIPGDRRKTNFAQVATDCTHPQLNMACCRKNFTFSSDHPTTLAARKVTRSLYHTPDPQTLFAAVQYLLTRGPGARYLCNPATGT